MVITRKIQVVIDENKKKLHEKYLQQLLSWRDSVRKSANMIVAHKFVQQNIVEFQYIKNGMLADFGIKDILKDEPGYSEQNVTYREVSKKMKGKVPSEIYSSLNQAVKRKYNKRIKDYKEGKATIPSYRNIPLPFMKKAFENLRRDGEDYYMDFYHIPLKFVFGKDRSGNRIIIDRAVAGEYSFCDSSLMICDKKENDKDNKLFLLVCVDIPQQKYQPEEGKVLYARLGMDYPMLCSFDKDALCERRAGDQKLPKEIFAIGTSDEFLYRRQEIQFSLQRAQKACKWTTGAKGREKKMARIRYWQSKEHNYVDTRVHKYSYELVKLAKDNNCEAIVLVGYKNLKRYAKENELDDQKFVLRNWSYYSMESKIDYKAKRYGIRIAYE